MAWQCDVSGPCVGLSRARPGRVRAVRVQDLCESRGGRPGLSVLTTEPSGFRGRKELLNRASALVSACP